MNIGLTNTQQQALAFVMAEPQLNSFYLSGGTALAVFYLQHRVSDDLDFFTATTPDGVMIDPQVQALKVKLGAVAVNYQKLHDRRLYTFEFTGETPVLKIEFTQYPFKQLEQSQLHNGIRVDSLRDIAANKLMALIDRFDPKDFVDLYFLMQTRRLADIRADAEQKFGITINPLTLGSELMKVDRVAALPKMLKPLTTAQLQEAIRAQAKTLRDALTK